MGARRDVLHDRRARPSAVVEWNDDRTLAAAAVRIPAGSWITIEPRAATEAPWGVVDRLWRTAAPLAVDDAATALTVVQAVDWGEIRAIPALAEPGRLPAGAGTAVLNLLATLARGQGATVLRYDGPYPTEALFLALLECFRPESAADDPLGRFMAGALAWTPAPFTPCFDDDVYLQHRDRIEKIVWRGRAYYREDWGGVRRWAPLRVDDVTGGVRGALWAFGRVLEEHVRLDADGAVQAVPQPPVADAPTRGVAPAVREGLVALVVAMSAAPLAGALREVAAGLTFTVGAVAGGLAHVGEREARIAATVAAALGRALAAAPSDRGARVALGALVELATALGDGLRARAQERLAAATPEAQAAAFAEPSREDDGEAARAITAAVARLLRSGRVDDEPDVERGEGGDRER